jgi:hypothetical protein
MRFNLRRVSRIRLCNDRTWGSAWLLLYGIWPVVYSAPRLSPVAA